MTLYYSITFGLLVLEVVTFLVLILPLPFSWRRRMVKFLATNPSELGDTSSICAIASLLMTGPTWVPWIPLSRLAGYQLLQKRSMHSRSPSSSSLSSSLTPSSECGRSHWRARLRVTRRE